ncbi:MAG TPA: peptidoglycan DD-metalloendopeptidase family protein [Xanthobacteraceae bacterium]|nr:peptidoglycan DD-metalloendopeptidase family protein [Xanthobacteraceae bacterium]
MAISVACAQAEATQKGAPALDALHQRDQELEALRAEQKKAAETQERLKSEIDSIGADRRQLNQALIDTAARIRTVESAIEATENRLKPLDAKERTLRQSLEGRRTVIAEVLAALQRIGRRPPPAVVARPDDALEAVRAAMLLGAVLPEMRTEAQTLANDLRELVRVRKDIDEERERLAHDRDQLTEERTRMSMLLDGRKKQQGDAEAALAAERQRADDLARRADTLKDLIGKLEQGLDPATRMARGSPRVDEPKPATDARQNLAALKDPGRLGPALAFASAKGMLRLPVNGVKIRDFGAPDRNGGTERGQSVATRPGAQVTAPCDGWVVYSGPFRSYGQLLILNAGGGYHVLLAGMERISVDLGQFVLTGEPVGVMGSGGQIASAVTAGSSQPVLYIEFRKDGTPVDPTPWWATTDNEKVRG